MLVFLTILWQAELNLKDYSMNPYLILVISLYHVILKGTPRKRKGRFSAPVLLDRRQKHPCLSCLPSKEAAMHLWTQRILTGKAGVSMNICRGIPMDASIATESRCYQFTHPFEDIEVKQNAPALWKRSQIKKMHDQDRLYVRSIHTRSNSG